MADAPHGERTALSREYSQFLVELSIALHKFSMYPSGHPALGPATEAVVARAAELLRDRSQLSFGIARRQLIIEGSATNEHQPVLRRLAEGLHRHHLAAVTLRRGLEAAEVADAVRALAREPEDSGPLGGEGAGRQLRWPHLQLHPLSFDGLTMASDAPVTGTPGEGGGLRGAELWIGLARAAMSGERVETDHDAGEPAAAMPSPAAAGDATAVATDAARLEPLVVARAIDARAGAAAYDQVIVGYLLQIARELRDGSGADMAALRRRTARLVGALSPDTLRRLVDMGGDTAQRRSFVLDASQGMAVDAVLDIVKAAADASGQTISHGLVRMLSKLAAHAEFGESQTRPAADAALREQVGQLLAGWHLDDPNPSAYTAVLQHVAVTAAVPAPDAAVLDDSPPFDPLRLVQTAIEVGEVGPMIDRAIDAVLCAGRAGALLDAIDGGPPQQAAAAARIRARLVEPGALRRLADGATADFAALDRLVPHLTERSYATLLEVLATSEHRIVRRRLLDRLATAPFDIGPMIVAALQNAPWFVARNMLVLLERLERVPDELSLGPWLTHQDVRIRYEAIRVQLRLPGERENAVRAALADGHPRLVHRGLVEVQADCPATLVEPVAAVALDPAASDDLRVLAARALGHGRGRRAVDALLALVGAGFTLLGRPRLAPSTPPMLAAVAALADGWQSDPRAAELVRLAAASADPALRQAAAGEAS